MPLVPGGLDIPAIIAAVAADATAATTQGYAVAAAATSPSVDATTAPSSRVLYLLKLLHLCFIYGVATDADIPRMWLDVFRAPTKATTLAVLSQYLWARR